jgi:hypothetical protein
MEWLFLRCNVKKLSEVFHKGKFKMDEMGHTSISSVGARGEASARVAVFDMNFDGAKRIADEIDGEAFACNVSNAASTETAEAASAASLGTTRIAVNCTGTEATGEDRRPRWRTAAVGFRQNNSGQSGRKFNILRLAATGK